LQVKQPFAKDIDIDVIDKWRLEKLAW